jgi:uncharacterized protein YycO
MTAHEEVPPGTFGLTTVGGMVGWMIAVGQLLAGDVGRYGHAFVCLGGDAIVEAEPGGARVGRLSDYLGVRSTVLSRDLVIPDDRRELVCVAARSYVGTPYSYLDYASLALAAAHIRLPFVARYVAATGHMICSQLVDRCYLDAGVHLFDDGRLPGDVTPGDLLGVLTKEGLAKVMTDG